MICEVLCHVQPKNHDKTPKCYFCTLQSRIIRQNYVYNYFQICSFRRLRKWMRTTCPAPTRRELAQCKQYSRNMKRSDDSEREKRRKVSLVLFSQFVRLRTHTCRVCEECLCVCPGCTCMLCFSLAGDFPNLRVSHCCRFPCFPFY